MWWNDKYKEKIKGLERKIESFEREKRMDTQIRQENKTLSDRNEQLTVKINEVNSKLREQTEADLYLHCAKTMKKIERGYCKEKTEINKNIDYITALREQLGQSQPMYLYSPGAMYSHVGANLLGALGQQNIYR